MDTSGVDSAEHRQRRLVASHEQSVRQVGAARIAIYGLPSSWMGRRYLGSTAFESGVERAGDGTTTTTVDETIELIHERPDTGSHLSVESSSHPGDMTTEALTGLLERFDANRARDAARRRTVRKPPRAGAAIEAGQLTVVLDGRPTAFAVVHSGGLVVARWPSDGVTITIKAELWPHIDTLMLDQVTELTPYLDGRRARLEEASGFRLA